jgi:bifunctional DNA-binding transcriptional regulator/antitoxin component of YhaV-PrlF toxin-antitoxin module
MVKGEKTVLTKANNESYSLRTTVPKGIASQFELKEGDSIIWKIKPTPDGKNLFIAIEIEKNAGKRGEKNAKRPDK